MKGPIQQFNLYLWPLMLAALLSAGGCGTVGKDKDKKATLLRFHLEVPSGSPDRDVPAMIYRSDPVQIHVKGDPFLNEGDVAMAAVVPAMGGFSIKVQLNQHGTWVLDSITSEYKGRRMAIFSHFGEARWLAAPMITKRISDGLLVFTPDADYDEAQRIVRGLNNIADELKKDSF